ncbi:MAG TPA: GNAT family N-acyltransferase [Bacteroidales bacterium]|nr:GNAT family N-acyltransferase [Bacteroidales bacterium]
MPDNSEFQIPEGVILAETLLRIFNHQQLQRTIKALNDPIQLIDTLINQIEIKYEIPPEDIKNIPAEGPFIIVSNHPYRGIDSMLLYKLISRKRKDFRIMASYLLQNIEPLKDIVIPVSTFETSGKGKSIHGLKEAINHLRDGHCIGIFPAGEESMHIEISNIITDKVWLNPAIKFIRNANVPVIPVYFHGTRSRLSLIIGKLHPILSFGNYPAELRKRNRNIRIRIGSPVSIKEQSYFRDISQYGRYLRARTYSLGTSLEAKRFFSMPKLIRKKAEPITAPVPAEKLIREFNCIRQEYELFTTGVYSVVCAPTLVIPDIITEIGRLREETFRKVGEGTNKSIDIDEYDLYFNHLFIWDLTQNRIVGAYRIGKGREILSQYGINGFYISSLFKIRQNFSPILSQSLELGRSFITEEYQKKAFPLFLLWKGIMFFLLKNPQYRYLIGPVSISNDFSKYSKNLIVSFITKYFTDKDLASQISPRKEFVIEHYSNADSSIFVDTSESDINRIEKIIMDIEPGYRLPVLLKKYLEINGRIIGFNVDPKFNYCLDGLMLLDIYKTPPDFIKGLSRELNDPAILERFMIQE